MPPAPEAKFKVLEKSKAEELDRVRKSYPRSHLILGSLYERAGLLDDAEREFQSLVSANPKSTVARKLLRNVRSLRQK
jgi:lipopolysaccharide biosynthesis regulator YciM